MTFDPFAAAQTYIERVVTVKGRGEEGEENLLEQPGVQKYPEQGTQGKKSLSTGLCTSPAHVLSSKKNSRSWSNDGEDRIIFHTVDECVIN